METTLPDQASKKHQAPDSEAKSASLSTHEWLGMSAKRIESIQRTRRLKDRVARALINIGGVAVIGAVALIFFYLLIQILPLFQSAELADPESLAVYQTGYPDDPNPSAASYLSIEEQTQTAIAVYTEGEHLGLVHFYELFPAKGEAQTNRLVDESIKSQLDGNGAAYLTKRSRLPLIEGIPVTAIGEGSDKGGDKSLIAFAQDGEVLFWRHTYDKIFESDELGKIQGKNSPNVEFPYGELSYPVVPAGESVKQLSLVHTSDALVVVSYTESGRLFLKKWSIEEDLFGESRSLEELALKELPAPRRTPLNLKIEPSLKWLYLPTETTVEVYNLLANEAYHSEVEVGSRVTATEFLLGDISLLIGDQNGVVSQWFMVRDESVYPPRHVLTRIRDFKHGDSPIASIQTEQRRKSFYVIDEAGQLGIYYSTAHSEVFKAGWFAELPKHFSIAPRGNFLLYDVGDKLATVRVDNQHPEVSWSSIWEEVWYENYIEPEYIWQSSAANNDFEPKFSLTPLAFGTLKAAIYAMIVAVPLSICGAIYTAYFMAPALRQKIKPTIEFMEALPTVILGFLAGLWLAPFVENHLPGIFSLLLIMPVSFIAVGYLYSLAPKSFRSAVPDGWQPVFLIPIVILVAALSIALSGPIENAFFGGDVRSWLTNDMGIDFDQRNALVVGLAMGFAVIPTIYSITEDALFAVPKSLSFGSLALGATPWQTMVRVILPTASPGIFSALMIGFGRAVGETMIVLMATGNTPIMDMNIFEGLRTLSANIAVEMPEAELHSTHYRLLFLAAFVLFVITFCFNTSAEVVRQRLREKYGSL